MCSLVPDYENSDSDENNDSPTKEENSDLEQNLSLINETLNNSPSTDSEDESATKDIHLTSINTQSVPTAQKLPKPGFLSSGNDKSLPTTSVFFNPYIEAENAKKLALEKHVKMVDSIGITLSGKKVCWNYRKGKCKFGSCCKYSHDSDIRKAQGQLDEESKILCQSDKASSQTQAEGKATKSNCEAANLNKRKRPGLTQGLQPGKKVLKQYYNLKNQH